MHEETIRALAGVEGVLLDLDGVVTTGGASISGSLDAIARLRARGIPLRFLTNTTRRPRRRILADLERIGLRIDADELFTPATSARQHLVARDLRPLLVIHPDLQEDFAGLTPGRDAVVLADAAEHFSYANLNTAFRALRDGAQFLALARNRNFRDADGELSLDVGGFVAALEYASGREAMIFGKPSPDFFRVAAQSLGLSPQKILMVGDDAEADIGGAMAAGFAAALVRTGKYLPGQEKTLISPPTLLADDLAAVEIVLSLSKNTQK